MHVESSDTPLILNYETGELLSGDKARQFAAEHNIDLITPQEGEVGFILDFDPTTLSKPNSRIEFVSFMQDWYNYFDATTEYVHGKLNGVLLKKWWKNYGKDKEALPAHKYPTLKTTKKIVNDISKIIPMSTNERLGMESIVNAWFFL